MATHVGITHVTSYLPPGRMSAEAIAERSLKSAEAIKDELGLLEKPVGALGESALDHAIKAGQAMLADLDPTSIDMLIYASGSMPDYPLWWGVYKLHEHLGLKNARMLELRQGCIGSLHALEAAKSYIQGNESINRVLVVAAEGYHFNETFADYGNPDNEPMYFFADGAAAALIESDRHAELPNALGQFSYLVDSSHYGDVPIPAGGAKRFTTAETVEANLHALQLPPQDPQQMRRFGIRYIQNYITVIRQALEASGHAETPDFVISNQLKPALLRILLTKLGLSHEQTIYTMPHWGHIGVADILLGIGEASREGRWKSGQTAAVVSSGVSFSWGACALEIR